MFKLMCFICMSNLDEEFWLLPVLWEVKNCQWEILKYIFVFCNLSYCPLYRNAPRYFLLCFQDIERVFQFFHNKRIRWFLIVVIAPESHLVFSKSLITFERYIIEISDHLVWIHLSWIIKLIWRSKVNKVERPPNCLWTISQLVILFFYLYAKQLFCYLT